ncbi:DEAD/DEAH box helicase [Verrucomicrobium sp. BvORR106]|uniref:DEAD/DEAH box helicase n=1 Tax=Verrucomicrobium sp. BvORR106 TaxID=1403819 RepID=UPI00056E622A|nr:DEAD/DEAH box helicase [Verrucomicrobium sp. BvORR106]
MDEAFAKLHRKIQEAIFREGWSSLRPLQKNSIRAVHESKADLILAASTASGKTEAAFLPILSEMADEPHGSVRALYISPLKALINDQFMRLERLCELAEIPVHRWHGDVGASHKARLRREPGGVLLITPESLESQFVNMDRDLPGLYSRLGFVVIDELHAFLDNVRGIHLRSLLARLEVAAGVRPRLVGLSATLGDFGSAKGFLNPDDPSQVLLLQDASQAKEKHVGLRAYYESVHEESADEDAEQKELAAPLVRTGGLNQVAADLARRFMTDTNLVFCNSRRDSELLADKLHQMEKEESWPHNPFLLHHGSLSKEIREDAEVKLKSGRPVTALCTSTLEMGIDIGAVRAVGQVGPPWTVSSMVQRLGRSGREEGQPQILRLYTLDLPLDHRSHLEERLFPNLVRSAAMIELYREGWLEPPELDRFHFSTAIHQVFSILKQTGGALATVLHDRLCLRGAFRRIDRNRLYQLLKGMASHQLIEQVPSGELILAPAGERIVESRDFYAAFASRIEYSVEWDGSAIGVLPLQSIPAEGEFMLLAGRRWKVMQISREQRRVLVVPALGWKPPRFLGGGGLIHAVVMAKMRETLAGEGEIPYLHEGASQMLVQARQCFKEARLTDCDFKADLHEVHWLPWSGTRVLLTLELCAKIDGLKVGRQDFSLSYAKLSVDGLKEHCQRIADGGFTEEMLLEGGVELLRDRFDEYVAVPLLQEAYAREVLDLPGARQAAGRMLGGSR